MALLVIKQTKFGVGVVATYFHIRQSVINKVGNSSFFLDGFTSKQDRIAGASAVIHERVEAVYDLTSPLTESAQAYELAKADPYFAGATDDI